MTDEARLQEIISEGALIEYVSSPVLRATVGYLELWPEYNALFFNEVGDSSTGQQHVLVFDRFEIKGDQAIFWKAGEFAASIAPYHEFPVDVDQLMADWQEWLLDQPRRRPLDIENAAQYRNNFHLN